jgi:hypothetical protein
VGGWCHRCCRREPTSWRSRLISDHQAQAQTQALAEAAAGLQGSEADLAAAAVRDLIAQPADDFDAAAQRVLGKNAELVRRLA